MKQVQGYGGDNLKVLTWLTIVSWFINPVIWIVGSEGTAALGLSQQVTFTFLSLSTTTCIPCVCVCFTCSLISTTRRLRNLSKSPRSTTSSLN